MGVIAQEVEKIFPELVSETGLDADTGEKYKSVQYLGLIAPLIEAIKELNAKNEFQNNSQEKLIIQLNNTIDEMQREILLLKGKAELQKNK